ncbi:MAG: lysophospholipid acyltransferase family protein [Gammaproteobacteria bacterium]
MSTLPAKLSLGFLSYFPLSTHHRLGKFIGSILFIFNNRNKHISQVNIDICFTDLSADEKKKLLKKTLQENGKTLIECFWLWRHPQQVLDSLLGNVKNHELLKRSRKQGTIFVTPHFGSWEFIGLLTAANSDLLILYAPPKSKHITVLSCQGRSSTGGTVISTDELNAKRLIKHIKNGGSVGILPDQVPDGNGGVQSSFFGRKTYTSTLVCKLAKKLQCPVVFCYALRNTQESLRYDAYYYEASKEIYNDDIYLATDALNKCIEGFVYTAPEQYIWGYKRFKIPAPGDSYPY